MVTQSTGELLSVRLPFLLNLLVLFCVLVKRSFI